jgi:hypothetical protein
MKRAYNKGKIDGENYVNLDTGELLSSSHPNLSSVNLITNKKIIGSEEYIIIDSDSLRFISIRFKSNDLGRILAMSNMIGGPFNILYRAPHEHHTGETLMVKLDYTVNKYRDFMKRLHKEGVIAYLSAYKDGVECKYILFNPHIARKGKVFHEDCLRYFEDFPSKLKREKLSNKIDGTELKKKSNGEKD